MVNYREILRLSALRHVQRDICSAMHCSDHTVRAVLKEAAKHNIHWHLDEDITNAELERILFPNKYRKSGLTLSQIIRTFTVILQSLALRWLFFGKNIAANATKSAARLTLVPCPVTNTANGRE